MLDVDLYVFDDEKSIGSGFKLIKPPYIPLLPHKCHFYCHTRDLEIENLIILAKMPCFISII